MSILPEEIVNVIQTQCILLRRQENGWTKLHHEIKNTNSHLIDTGYNDELQNIEYSNIKKVRSLYLNRQKYTWLKKIAPYSKNYFFSKQYSSNINDIYSTDENGNFLDDEYMYQSSEDESDEYM